MATRKPGRGSSGGNADGGEGGGESLGRNEDADPVQVHRDYVERRIGGGAPPTPEAYARAIEQFHRLPGAVRVPSTELTEETARRRGRDKQAELADEAEADVEASEYADTSGVWEPER